MSNRLVRSFGVAAIVSLWMTGCGGMGGNGGSTGTNLGPTGADAGATVADSGAGTAGDAAQPVDTDGGTPADGATTSTAPTGAWQVKTVADQMAAGFQTVTINADGTYTETGRTDGIGETGQYTQPTTITIDPSFGTAPAGMVGPYIALSDNPLGDQTYVYGWVEAADHSALTLTLYANTNGMGLRWAAGQVINLVPVGSSTLPASPAGTWQVSKETDANTIGFQTLELDASGFVAETGRTDGSVEYMNWTAVTAPSVDPSYGPAPAGMVGPYISLDNSQYNGDGNWVYGWSEAADGSTLTLTLYAQRNGMGLRWATPVTVTLVKGSTGAAPTGGWKTATATDTTNAGFSTITFWLDSNYTETGRTDGESGQGTYTEPTAITIDPDFGNAPAGMTGPYVQLYDATDDQYWVYGWVINPDASLTLTLYAKTNGMGLRWANPVETIHLLKN